MKFLKALFNWKVWLSVILGVAFLAVLWTLTFNWLSGYTNHGESVDVPDISKLSIKEALAELDDMGLQYNVDSVKFSEDYAPYQIIEFYPKAGSKVKPGRRIFIKSNPSDWQPVELPDLIDKSKRLAFTLLNMRGFKVGDTIYVKDIARDAVLKVQYDGEEVRPKTLLPRGAKVDLVLGRGLLFDMPVPDLQGLTLEEAEKVMEDHFFEKGMVSYLVANVKPSGNNDSSDESMLGDSLQMRVVYQEPPVNELYDEGLPISLWLSYDDKKALRKEIDSLDVVYRRKVDENDSIFYKSIDQSKSVNIRNLPEEIRNQVKNDANVDKNLQVKPKKKSNNAPAKVNQTGIEID